MTYHHILYVFCLALLNFCGTALAETEVRGTVLGADGKAMKMAHVHLKVWNAPSTKGISYPVAADGSFSFRAEDGFATLEFTGVDHKIARMNPVYLCGEPVQLKVQLSPNTLPSSLKDVQLCGGFNDYLLKDAISMTKQADGSYVADVPSSAGSVGYQIILLGEGTMTEEVRPINGTQAESFKYDGNTSSYRSFAKVENGKAHIVFNPALLATTEGTARTEYADVFSKKVQTILTAIQENRSEVIKARMELQQGKTPSYNPVAVRAAIRKKCDAEKNPRLRELMMLQYLDVTSLNKDAKSEDAVYIDEVLRVIPPTSRVWEYGDFLVLRAVQQSSTPTNSEYLQRLLDQHPSVEFKARILYNLLYQYRNDGRKDDLAATYKRLQTEYPTSRAAQSAKKEFNPDRAVNVGKTIPDFSFIDVRDTAQRVTPATLKGKWVLIDNWATWCGPCVREMPVLHQIYEKFKAKNFEILSVSFDRTMNDIARFRDTKWEMPWLHAFSPGVWQNEATKIFEVTGIPKPILINPDGVIVTLDGLRGEVLEQTLNKYLQ